MNNKDNKPEKLSPCCGAKIDSRGGGYEGEYIHPIEDFCTECGQIIAVNGVEQEIVKIIKRNKDNKEYSKINMKTEYLEFTTGEVKLNMKFLVPMTLLPTESLKQEISQAKKEEREHILNAIHHQIGGDVAKEVEHIL